MSDKYPQDIEDQMQIKPMEEIPETIEGVLTQHQLEVYPERDRPVLLAVSELHQLILWNIRQFAVMIDQARRSEAAIIRKITIARRIANWTAMTVCGAIIYALAEHYFAK